MSRVIIHLYKSYSHTSIRPELNIRTQIITTNACFNKAWQCMGSQLYCWSKRSVLFFNQKPLPFKGLCRLELWLVDFLSGSGPAAKHLIKLLAPFFYHLFFSSLQGQFYWLMLSAFAWMKVLWIRTEWSAVCCQVLWLLWGWGPSGIWLHHQFPCFIWWWFMKSVSSEFCITPYLWLFNKFVDISPMGMPWT